MNLNFLGLILRIDTSFFIPLDADAWVDIIEFEIESGAFLEAFGIDFPEVSVLKSIQTRWIGTPLIPMRMELSRRVR